MSEDLDQLIRENQRILQIVSQMNAKFACQQETHTRRLNEFVEMSRQSLDDLLRKAVGDMDDSMRKRQSDLDQLHKECVDRTLLLRRLKDRGANNDQIAGLLETVRIDEKKAASLSHYELIVSLAMTDFLDQLRDQPIPIYTRMSSPNVRRGQEGGPMAAAARVFTGVGGGRPSSPTMVPTIPDCAIAADDSFANMIDDEMIRRSMANVTVANAAAAQTPGVPTVAATVAAVAIPISMLYPMTRARLEHSIRGCTRTTLKDEEATGQQEGDEGGNGPNHASIDDDGRESIARAWARD